MNVERSRRGALRLAVISPAIADPREFACLGQSVAAGLERYHVRKPGISRDALAAWLRRVPGDVCPRLVLHQHHELAAEFGLGGCHWRDDGAAPAVPPAGCGLTSRSCHDLGSVRAAMGRYDSVFLGPLFPPLSKPGRGALAGLDPDRLVALLAGRSAVERGTVVVALGGVTAARLAQVRAWGFDGAAVLGAVWQAADPVAAFRRLQVAAHESTPMSTNNS